MSREDVAELNKFDQTLKQKLSMLKMHVNSKTSIYKVQEFNIKQRR